jgi:hypothetical protein
MNERPPPVLSRRCPPGVTASGRFRGLGLQLMVRQCPPQSRNWSCAGAAHRHTKGRVDMLSVDHGGVNKVAAALR